MALQLTKSYRLLRFLNRRHGPLVWGAFTAVSYLYALVVTGRSVLARSLAGSFYQDRDFKLGLRRAAWYFRLWRPGLKLAPADPMFDFTEGLSLAELDAVEALLERRRSRLEDADFHRFALSCLAHRAELLGSPGREQALDGFADHADALLALLPPPPSDDASTVVLPPTEHFREGDFNVADARQALQDFAALFPIAQVPWFVISGTFLGLIRENGFLPHDYDIDLGVMSEAVDLAAIMKTLDASDAFVVRKFDVLPTQPDQAALPTLIKILHRKGVHLDLFVHYRDETARGPMIWHGSSLHRWENAPFELVPYHLEGVEVLGPDNSDRYLSENYGDWQRTVTDFSCTTDTPNMVVMPRPKSVAVFLNRLTLEARRPGQYPLALQDMLLASGALTTPADGQGALRLGRDFF